MRLHRLEVDAFGPFARHVEVDLDALSSSGLFLVHGPTGAGKTSLLDAVCFALYADVPGARTKRGLRSDHAAPDAVPMVRLELTVGGRRLRIERSPEFQRPKKRGSGTTKVQARVVLEERRGSTWVPLSNRNDEVADLVKDVVGLGLAQFARVVLLPQGEFAAFLRATPEERREVLERLFDISVFADVEAWLAETRRTSAAALDAAHRDLASDLARLEDALAGVLTDERDVTPAEDDGAPEDEPVLTELPVALVPGRLAELADSLDTRLTTALALVDAAEGADRLAHEARVQAARVADLRERGARATAALAQLDAAAPEHAERVARLDAAVRAAALAGHHAAVARAEVEAERVAATLAGLHQRLARTGFDLEDGSVAEVAATAHGHDDTVAVLRTGAAAAQALRRRVDSLVVRRDTEDAAAASATAALEQVTPELERLVTEVARLAAAAERLPGLELAVRRHEERLGAHRALASDVAVLEAVQPALLAARDAVLGHQDHLIGLRQRRLDGMAAELAAALDDGTPCPVCGATEHPHRAEAGDPVTPDDVEAAELLLDAARVELARVEARVAGLESSVATRRESLGGSTAEAVEAELSAAAVALAAAEAERHRADEAASRLADLRRRTTALETTRDGALATVAALTEQLTEAEEEAAAVADALADALAAHAPCPCGSTDGSGHGVLVDSLDTLVRAQDDLAAARARAEAAADDLARAVGEAGFDSVDEARAGALPADRVLALRAEVTRHDEARAGAVAVVDDPEVAAALAGPAPDLDATEGAARTARQAAVAAATQREVLTRAVRVLTSLRPALEATCASVARLADRHAAVRDLADLTGGTGPENTLRMRLTSFVLASRLEKVAALANERLAVMGGGRYLLEHSDERASGNGRSGLGLRVLDQWTGRTRETASLSGGESFMASLALALGLADAVKEEAGGHDLATLFVDEGFGSLDDASLEEVLTVLDTLREGGRAVGVVSHVADLRARVPAQVVVHKGTDGSAVEVRVPGRAEPAA